MESELQARSVPELRINVGSLLNQGAGTSRVYEFDLPSLHIDDDLDLGYLRGFVRFTRTSEGLYLEGRLGSDTALECDRCLKELTQPLTVKLGDLLFYPAQPGTESVPATGIVDLTPLLREHLLLGLPTQPLCRADCKGLCPVCGGDLNESSCTHPETGIDPRLAGLKSLLPES